MKDYLADFLSDPKPEKSGDLYGGNPQNPQKVERNISALMPGQPSKPSKPTFEGFEGEHPNSFPQIQTRIGTFARPMTVRGNLMPSDCLWGTCDGYLTGKGRDLYRCNKCETWFQLLASETGFVYVGDLADDFDRSDASEWVM